MQPQKFEEEVQRKMDDLEFVPSAAVWENVLRNVTPRRRRRMVAAWWWLGPGLLVLGAGGALLMRANERRDLALGGPAVKTSHQVVAGAAGKQATAGAIKNGSFVSGGGVAREGTNGLAGADRDGSGKLAPGAVANGENNNALREHTPEANGADEGTVTEGSTGVAGAPSGRRSFARSRPGLIGGFARLFGVSAPDLHPEPVKPAVSGISEPKRPWRAGFVAGGGIATVEGLGSAAPYGMNASAVTPTTISGGTYGLGPVSAASARRFTARARPDLSYRMGVFGEKPLSSRWAVDVGLDLHYYAVQLLAEQQAVGYAPSSASLLQQTALTYAYSGQNPLPPMSEQTYLNKYFFLEMPVAAQWRINHSRMLPVFWRGGAILSYLMASNAVTYDSKSGTLSSGRGTTRRVQASINTGLMVGFPLGGVEFQAGPEVQYAVTGLQNTASAGHLVYGGMRIAIMR